MARGRSRKTPEIVIQTTLQADGKAKLKHYVEAIEEIRQQISDLNADISEFYKAAKGDGFDTRAMKAVIAERRRPASERQMHEELVDLYRHALGMTPLEAEIERQREAEAKERAEAGKTDAEIARDDPEIQAAARDLSGMLKADGASASLSEDPPKRARARAKANGDAAAKAAAAAAQSPNGRPPVNIFGPGHA